MLGLPTRKIKESLDSTKKNSCSISDKHSMRMYSSAKHYKKRINLERERE